MFLLINLLIALITLQLVHGFEPTFTRKNQTTEATFSAIPENQHFDFVLIGTSHAREFSRSGNHQMVEKITGKNFFNLSKGSGHGGLLPNITAWNYFRLKGNTTRHVVCFVDPWVFFSPKWNEENYFLEDEPIKTELFWLAVKSGYSPGVLFNYFKSKIKPSYFSVKPISEKANNQYLLTIDTSLVRKQNEKNYLDGLDVETFKKYTRIFSSFIGSLQKQGIRVTLIIPPTLLGEEPGSARLRDFLSKIKGAAYIDHTHSYPDPKLYYDLHHLNSAGVQIYTIDKLKELVN